MTSEATSIPSKNNNMITFATYRLNWLVALFLLCASICNLEINGIVNERNAMTVTKSVRTKSNLAMSVTEDSDLLPGRLNITDATEIADNCRTLPRLTWRAAAKSSVRVKESKRTCEEYMRLPPSECKFQNTNFCAFLFIFMNTDGISYFFHNTTDSVLTAEEITRLSATEFRCTLPCMNFFGTKIQPVLYVDVTVYPEHNRSEIVVLRAETVGSEAAERVNGTFNISAVNIVSAGNLLFNLQIKAHSNRYKDLFDEA